MSEEHTLTLTSAGIDVGTTTSHLIFSKLKLEKIYTPRGIKFEITEREILYKGDIILTPLTDAQTIDYLKLVEFLKREYENANMSIDDIDTGAVIITGESAKKENAEDLVKALAHKAGKFVCAAAGPNFESVIAAMGSGAVQYSKEAKKSVINIDIGGGTSNIAIVKDGEIVEAACVNVGGRLVAFDGDSKIIRIEAPIRILEEQTGINFDYGLEVSEEKKREMAQILADSLFEVINQKIETQIAKNLLMTNELNYDDVIDEIIFSGGVAEYIYHKTDEEYGDLGKYLGEEIRRIVKENKMNMHEPIELIRATVIGAGQYTLQVSGVTTHISDIDILPIHNIPVLEPKISNKEINEENVRKAILKSFEMFDVNEGEEIVALSFKGAIGGSYAGLTTFAKGVVDAIPNTIAKEKPIIMIFDRDIGNSVGNVMKRETIAKQNIISVDEINVQEGDFIDVDKPKAGGQVVPVVIKSLVFSN
ncbi:MAG: ethanolamine ammonia-lyase reactivating factor EutA [Candidatus Heimdallarchaeota archaeon]|nr:ethanolamine ammonia-lyase reactivating factor EutA [Candidatus Heimdallarchaeota archaeon]MCK4954263.1 ethanolamine ammonia-lyase reactivating factor EutA [Candidatus Heimdallarchaeota archaeon]